MFVIHKGNTGAVSPWEYMEAAAGTYKAGQLVTVTDGKIAALTAASAETPPYLCMADAVIADGEQLPVTRTSKDFIYETTLEAEAAGAKIGTKLQVSASGLTADGSAAGTFEIVQMDENKAGAAVFGRWA